jgi:hypothetical protein
MMTFAESGEEKLIFYLKKVNEIRIFDKFNFKAKR